MQLPKNKTIQAGFTLIELLVVLAIFVIVTSVVLFQYGNLRSSSSLSNLATDMSLSIRRAQSYAIGAANSGFAASNFTHAYGVHFSADTPPVVNQYNGSNNSFVMFTDVSDNGMYDVNSTSTPCNVQNLSTTSECTELLTISNADRISAIYLNGTTPINAGDSIDVMFLRPNPDAFFCYRPSGFSSCSATSISSVTIEISNPGTSVGNTTQDIVIWSTGQISVQ
jgi:prepilin-type N-terminal cleavage/methylation domain-containing protein